MTIIFVKNEKGEMVEVSKRRVSRAPQPQGPRKDTVRLKIFKGRDKGVEKAKRQVDFYKVDK